MSTPPLSHAGDRPGGLVQTALRGFGDVAAGSLLQSTEIQAERLLLFVGEPLIVIDKDTETIHAGLQNLDLRAGQWLGDVDTGNLAGEAMGQFRDRDGHGVSPSIPPPWQALAGLSWRSL